MQIHEMRKLRDELLTKAEAVIDLAETEDRDLSDDEQAEVDGYNKRAARLNDRIKIKSEVLQADEAARRSAEVTVGSTPEERQARDRQERERTTTDREQRQAEQSRAFRNYLKHGEMRLSAEDRDILNDSMRRDLTREERALAVGTDAAGGYTVPEGFFNQLTEAMLQFDVVRGAGATVIRTESGNSLPMPTNDDTGNKGAIVGENSAHTDDGGLDPAFGVKTLGSYMYSSEVVRVSFQLLQDSAFNIEAMLARKLGERIGRITGEHFTTGTGSGQPEGIVTGARVGRTAQAQAAITYDEVVDLVESIDQAYQGNVQLMFNQSTKAALAKLKDSDGRPLFNYDAQGMPQSIYGKRYIINNDMPNIGTSAKPIVAGDFSYYYIRDIANSMTVVRFNETFAASAQIGFLALSRHDGLLLDPSAAAASGPVKVLQMAGA